ncbi:hypothetical protein M501DRAFT_1016460 [Patellaria atrata CBS 101060]|uniref:Peptidase C14 caspase domain-containing protein n=1 Tax=Patellaria atrata CBS 101060 TaxID=1346257 RepID=A0A9P4SBD3_9PEZI|nr:hypothetical protein M501DRAFT_1016460 [Patellaria atrata CBS 101060]
MAPMIKATDLKVSSKQGQDGKIDFEASGSATIEPTSPRRRQPSLTNGNHERPDVVLPDLVTEEENSKMQISWNTAMCAEMKIPLGYQEVAVLIIKWADAIDELECSKEVKELKELFEAKFHYSIEVIELNTDTPRARPQLQLEKGLINFVDAHNGPHNLLIVYYTGHGSFTYKTEELKLHASSDIDEIPVDAHPAFAVWNRAENSLIEHSDCDMLSIFDCCYASNIFKNVQRQDPRTYEMLTASGHDKPTQAPGPKSFTRALITSLSKLLEESEGGQFTTRQLCESINVQEARKKFQSQIWSRFKRYDRHIQLGPLKNSPEDRRREFIQDQTRSLLTLSLPLTVSRLSDEEIKTLSRALAKAAKDSKLPVKRVDWRKLRSSGRTSFSGITSAHGVARKWKNQHDARKRARTIDSPTRAIREEMADNETQTVDLEDKRTDGGREQDALSPIKRQQTAIWTGGKGLGFSQKRSTNGQG